MLENKEDWKPLREFIAEVWKLKILLDQWSHVLPAEAVAALASVNKQLEAAVGMLPVRCTARFVPQAWINDYAVEVDGAKEFDITAEVEVLGKEESLLLRDDDYCSDNMVSLYKVAEAENHSGPYRVELQQSIRDYWDYWEEP